MTIEAKILSKRPAPSKAPRIVKRVWAAVGLKSTILFATLAGWSVVVGVLCLLAMVGVYLHPAWTDEQAWLYASNKSAGDASRMAQTLTVFQYWFAVWGWPTLAMFIAAVATMQTKPKS